MQLGLGRGWGRSGTPQLCLGVEVMRASPAEPKSGQSTHGWGLFIAKVPFAWCFPTGGANYQPPRLGEGHWEKSPAQCCGMEPALAQLLRRLVQLL